MVTALTGLPRPDDASTEELVAVEAELGSPFSRQWNHKRKALVDQPHLKELDQMMGLVMARLLDPLVPLRRRRLSKLCPKLESLYQANLTGEVAQLRESAFLLSEPRSHLLTLQFFWTSWHLQPEDQRNGSSFWSTRRPTLEVESLIR
jgi:hypothetical protein